MKILSNTPKTTLTYAFVILILAVYAAVRIANLSQAVQKLKATADTPAYVRISKEPIFSEKFLSGARPLVFPLALKLLGGNAERVVWAQGIFSIVSWSVLAVSLGLSLQVSLMQLAGFGLALLLSLYRYVSGWDSVLLTESLSLSLMALFLAGWLWIARGWSWQKAGFLLLTAFFWAFCRDTNAWVLLMIAVFLVLLVGLRFAATNYLLLSFGFVVIFLLSNLSADIGERWVFPFQNVVGRRILPNRVAVDYFAGCGMPVSPALLQLTGEFANGMDRAFYEDPALAEYRQWVYGSGKSCYIKWLLSSPLESIRAPLREFDTLMSLENVQPFLFSKSFSPILPSRLEALLYPPQSLLVLFVAMWGIMLVGVWRRVWVRRGAWWVAIGMSMLVFPHYFITWHGDIMGIYRHVVGVSIQFYLAFWLLALFSLDTVLSLRVVQTDASHPLSVRTIKQ
jgi:hypothetical protein